MAQNEEAVPSGDLFPSNMTTIKEGKGDLMRSHGNLIFIESNDYLSPRDVTESFWRKYRTAVSLQNIGQYIWTFGGSLIATELCYSLIYNDGINLNEETMAAWGVITLIGAAMDFGGWLRLGNLAETYNTDPSVRKSYSLNIGPTKSGGFGLSLNF